MSAKEQYYDLLHAYALGCLDQKELNILNEFLDTGEEYFWEELGEYQNLTALLPSILNIETPGAELKDKVARSLYKIRNERRTRPVLEKPIKITIAEQKEVPVLSEERLSSFFSRTRIQMKEEEAEQYGTQTPNKSIHEVSSKQDQVKDFELVTTKEKLPKLEEKLWEDINKSKLQDEMKGDSFATDQLEIDTGGFNGKNVTTAPEMKEKKSYQLHGVPEKEESKKSYGGIIFSFILFLIVAAGLVYFYTKISSDVNTYKSGIDKLDNQIKDLSSKLADNQEIQNILRSKNARLINLSGTDISKESFGKLIINLETSKGYIHLNNMPQLQANEGYQLWVIINNKFVSLGVINPADKKYFYPFDLPALTNQGKTVFMVSEEPLTGSAKPSKNIYLTGTMD